jgi:serine protease Do
MKLTRGSILFLIIVFIFSCKNNYKSDKISDNNKINPSPVINASQFVDLADLQMQLHTIAKNHTPSVVSISTEKTVSQPNNNFDPFDFFFKSPWNWDDEDNNKSPKKREYKQGGLGSGVIYNKKGNKYYIITNNHVIEGVDKIKIIIDENNSYDGKILAGDPDVDIAVVEIETKDQLEIAKFGNSDDLTTGDFVIAIGNPFGLQGTMTFGIISALGRGDISAGRVNLTNFIQTDAAINPGNSGGPLINLKGEVIGINTLIYSRSGGNVGIGFAIPGNIAQNIAKQIIEKGKVEHGWLGVYFELLTKETIKKLNLKNVKKGIYITQVVEGSPADKAGIKAGDVILELNNKKITKVTDLTFAIGNSSPGTRVNLKLLRDGKNLDKVVTLGDRSEFNSENTDNNKNKEVIQNLGLELSELDNNKRKEYKVPSKVNGVIITNIDQRGPAARAGIEIGDVIYKINNKRIKTVTDVKKILEQNEDINYFFINRKGKEFIVKM